MWQSLICKWNHAINLYSNKKKNLHSTLYCYEEGYRQILFSTLMGVYSAFAGKHLYSASISLLFAGKPLYSAGISLLFAGKHLYSAGISLPFAGKHLYSAGISLLFAGKPPYSAGISLLFAGKPPYSTGISQPVICVAVCEDIVDGQVCVDRLVYGGVLLHCVHRHFHKAVIDHIIDLIDNAVSMLSMLVCKRQ